MFENFDDYFDCVLGHYSSPFPVDLIARDTDMTPEQIVSELIKRNLLVK